MASNRGVLKVTILGDEKPLKKSLDSATSTMSSWATGAVGVFAGLGAAGAAVLVHEFGDALEREKLADRLGASLGATPAEAARYGKVAGDLYAQAWGESLEEVTGAVDVVVSTLGDMDDDTLSRVTAQALDMASVFDVDLMEAVNAAGVAISTGLADDAEDAFDLMVSSMQRVPTAMRGELIPIVEEYAQNFEALGITGNEAFSLLVAASADGRFEIDKFADALKEASGLGSEFSAATAEAFEAIGLDAEEMANSFLAGGEVARGALDKTVEGLLAMRDPQEQLTAAVALFGEPLRDLSVTELPEFLERLRDMGGGLGDVEGSAQQMSDTLNDNVATGIEAFKRTAGGYIDEWVYVNVLPALSEVMDAFSEDGIGGALDRAVELWQDAQPAIEAWFNSTFMPWWEDTAVPWMQYLGGAMGTALVNGILEGLVNLLPELQQGVLDMVGKAMPFGAAGIVGNLIGDVELPNVDVPNFSNPITAPSSSTTSTSRSSTGGRSSAGLAAFHDGGYVAMGGVAEVAAKERVLSERQTVAFEQLVASATSGAGTAGAGNMYVTVNMPVGSDGNDVVNVLRRWNARNGPLPVTVAG